MHGNKFGLHIVTNESNTESIDCFKKSGVNARIKLWFKQKITLIWYTKTVEKILIKTNKGHGLQQPKTYTTTAINVKLWD